MKNTDKVKRPLYEIASDYFNYLGRHLPQQCASDEFYFLPRSEAAIQHLNTLDDLNLEKIKGHISYVQNLLHEISTQERENLEEEIDRLLLKQSMESFIREFDDAEVLRNDPTLYVKIPLFATDHILSQRACTPEQAKLNLFTLFAQIPSFLNSAIKNLRSPSKIALRIALNMVQDALQFYARDIRIFMEEKIGETRELFAKNSEVVEAWERYRKELLQLLSRN